MPETPATPEPPSPAPERPRIRIREQWTQRVLFETDGASDLKVAVEAAVRSGASLRAASLRGADLRAADLDAADLRGANLYAADLRAADLRAADLRAADLRAANLYGANLYGADLRAADLRAADLDGADLRAANLYAANLYAADLRAANLYGANLYAANLDAARINWQSHHLIAEILLRAAGADFEKRKVAGLVAISADWCWSSFLGLRHDPLFGWAVDTLAARVRDGDGAPEILARRAAELKVAETPVQLPTD